MASQATAFCSALSLLAQGWRVFLKVSSGEIKTQGRLEMERARCIQEMHCSAADSFSAGDMRGGLLLNMYTEQLGIRLGRSQNIPRWL